MKRIQGTFAIFCLTLAVSVTLFVTRHQPQSSVEELDVVKAPARSLDIDAGICPWRHPDLDRKKFFPSSNRTSDETLILSQLRSKVTSRLGHAPGNADNALRVHHILCGDHLLGTVISRYVRGESGAIELVLAIDLTGHVIGAEIQRLREPDEVAHELQSDTWLGAFRGKTSRSKWMPGDDLPAVSVAAQESARAIADNARTALTLYDVISSNHTKQQRESDSTRAL